MKKLYVLWCLVISISFLSMSMICIADGGAGDPDGCDTMPTPNYDGPLLQGTFIAAYDKGTCENEPNNKCKHFNIHIALEGMKMKVNGRTELHKKLYRINKTITLDESDLVPENLCNYQSSYLKDIYGQMPCGKGVAKEFGYHPNYYYPVLTDVTITQKDNCGNYDEATGKYTGNYKKPIISGTIKIRISPHANRMHCTEYENYQKHDCE